MRRVVPLLAATVLWALSCHGNQSPSLHEASDSSESAALAEWEATGALGQEHFREGNFPEAIQKFRLALAASPPHRQAYYLEWLAATLLAAHEYERVLEVAAEIDALEPASGAAILPRLKAYEALGRDAEGLALATRALDSGRRAALGSGSAVFDATEVRRLHAHFLAATGSLDPAIQEFEALLQAEPPLGVEISDSLRLLYVRAGRFRDALGIWRSKWGSDLALEPANLLAARHATLERLSTLADLEAAAFPVILIHLARAYASVGWIEEARATIRLAIHRLPEVAAARKLAEDLDRTASFIGDVKGEVYRGYNAVLAEGSGPSIEETLGMIEEWARIHGVHLEPDEIDDLSFFHRYVNPHLGGGRNLPEFFRAMGLFFVLFDYFGPVECNLKTLVFLDPDRSREVWGREIRYEMAICESSLVYHYREYLGSSSYGGLAVSPRGFWLDLDTYRRIARHVAAHYRQHRTSYAALFQPIERDPATPPDSVYYSHALKDRLAYLVGLGFADAAGGSIEHLEDAIVRALLESAEYHEVGHLVVQRTYLPIISNLLPGIGLLIREGFSADEIGAWSEEQAQLTALAHSRNPHLTLYRTVSSLAKSPDSSRHAQGYRRILAGYVEAIRDHPGEFPNIRAELPILDQLYLLTGDQIRRLARHLYRG